mmetsp:Transcript_35624/g.76061  ORF Transcript_35624/g.76061 Transcript_35624/m.76061 type:complete len:266 (-) Transcript_35624:43-840(-)|eukprot:CAMPEP_0183348216 /NCGR_PEP_ID=MMETSP0164_2-20130417/12799_1 /TAXON_ID=221442 /ORGANISM="Coccolithus pelagicus ssp braarudi, Strain PLY182g" /LENGTH=265 /DNA_ID=CAMNT_0025519771 /DNA_START=110 /DNA_END=907 /DNA_ORIENTATION=-
MTSSLSGEQEVLEFLKGLGLEHLAPTLTQNGFFLSLSALSTAAYEELLDCNIKPVHAKLILSSLSSTRTKPTAGGSDSKAGPTLLSFLRSVGLDHCHEKLLKAGFDSVEGVSACSLRDLIDAGLSPVHARLIVANLDAVGGSPSEFDLVAPARSREANSRAEGDTDNLLGGSKRSDHRARRLCLSFLLGLAMIAAAAMIIYAVGATAAPPPPAPPTDTDDAARLRLGGEGKRLGGAKGKHKGPGKGLGKSKGKGKRAKLLNASAV